MSAIRPAIPQVSLLALKVFVALLPALIVVALLHFRYGTNIYEHVPVWNDEVNYWHQAATFAAVGFEGGYYAPYESPARANWTRFGTHGPWYPMLYGTLGRLLGGWELYTPVIINLLLYTLAIATFIHTVNPNTVQLVVLGLILATIHPVLLYLPTGMSEAMHAAIAMLLAAIFWRLLRQRGQVKPWQMIGYGAFLWLVTVTRLSWGILLLPFFLLAFPFTVRGVLLALLMTGLSAGLDYGVVGWVTPSSQESHSVFQALQTQQASLFDYALHIWRSFRIGLNAYFSSEKALVDQWFSVQYWLVIAGLIIMGAAFALRTLRVIQVLHLKLRTLIMNEYALHLYNLLAVFMASMTLYIVAMLSDYRILGHHILMVLSMLALARRSMGLIVIFALLSVFAAGSFFEVMDVGIRKSSILHSELMMVEVPITYNPDAPSPWCNTLRIEVSLYGAYATRIPAGIGISWVWDYNALRTPVKARYVWLTDESADPVKITEAGLELRYLFSMPQGAIYLNEASACPP